MKIKAVISIILTLVLCFTVLPVSAFAGTLGDVDGSGKIESADARLALRASVGLETLTGDAFTAADADLDGEITSADARLILRASVGLEDLHKHSYTEKITVPATCEKKGSKTLTCTCGDTYTEEIPASGHKSVTDKGIAATCTKAGKTEGAHCSVCKTVIKAQTVIPAKGHTEVSDKNGYAATCTKSGKTESYHCSVCKALTKAQTVIPAGHKFSTTNPAAQSKCTVNGCNAVLPAFNDIVNVLKTTGNGVNYFTGIFKDETHYEKPEIGGLMGSMDGVETDIPETEFMYQPLVVNRLITKNNFHTKGEDFISALSSGNVKSIKAETVSGIEFLNEIDTKFSDGRTQYDVSAIKSAEFPGLYKITVVLPSEKIDITKKVSGTSVYNKIYTKDYNVMLESVRNEMSREFTNLEKELASLKDMISMKTAGSITSSLVVEYYVTVDGFTPVAAKYGLDMNVVLDIKVTDLVGISKLITMIQKMTMTSNSYYFFNNSFGM